MYVNTTDIHRTHLGAVGAGIRLVLAGRPVIQVATVARIEYFTMFIVERERWMQA